MYDTILVPIDGSSGAESAVNPVLDFARTFGADVHALYVVDTGSGPVDLDPERMEAVRRSSGERGQEAVDRVHERASDLGIETTRVVREGVPYRVIREYAAECDADLIVMGTHGRTAAERVEVGSTTERVITLAETPVMAVPTLGDGGADVDAVAYDRVVIATDGSDVAERAAERGLEIAESYGAAVHVVYVVDATTYALEDAPRSIIGLLKEGGRNAVEAIAAEGRDRGLSVRTDVLRGVPEAEIVEYADEVDGDLVVMGTRGRGGASSGFLGSTAARVLRRSTRPLLTVG